MGNEAKAAAEALTQSDIIQIIECTNVTGENAQVRARIRERKGKVHVLTHNVKRLVQTQDIPFLRETERAAKKNSAG